MSGPHYAAIKSNPRFELGWNRLQSAIEIFVTFVVVAGLLGLFGTGLLSDTEVAGPTGAMSVRYARILRRTVQSDVTISFSHAVGDTLAVEMPKSFIREMDIVTTSPRSATMHLTADGIAYVFDIAGTDHGEITLSMKPKSSGVFQSGFRVGTTDVALRQLVWP